MEINSESELDAALQEWGTLKARLDTISNTTNELIEACKRRGQEAAVCKVDDLVEMPIPARITELETACYTFAKANVATLIPNPKKVKSRELTHGAVGLAKKRNSVVEIAEGGDEVRAGILKRLITVVINCLKRVKLIPECAIKAAQLFNVKIEVNKTSVLDLFGKQQITDEQLATLGYKVDGGYDVLWIEPTAVKVTPHAGAVA